MCQKYKGNILSCLAAINGNHYHQGAFFFSCSFTDTTTIFKQALDNCFLPQNGQKQIAQSFANIAIKTIQHFYRGCF